MCEAFAIYRHFYTFVTLSAANADSATSESNRLKIKTYGAIAQLVEQRTENPCVAGSNPAGTTSKIDI